MDKTWVILAADKRVALVVLNKTDYINKAEKLLEAGTYKKIVTDPTNILKNRLIYLLKKIKAEGAINETLYMYPTGACAPKFYGLPKYVIDISLRPIVSSRGTATYVVVKEIERAPR